VNEQDDDDIGLWLSLAGRTDLPVLEVGAGTGRIAITLARAGHKVTAVDPSAAMLELARQKAGPEAMDLDLHAGRLPDIALPGEGYGLVLFPADVFLYCRDGEDQRANLRAAGAALAFNGVLAIDVPGPAANLDPTGDGVPVLVYAGSDAEGDIEVWQTRFDDLATQLRTLRVSYERIAGDGTVRRRVSVHRLRYLYRFELEYLLEQAGFTVTGIYGNYDLGPLQGESERMIALAMRSEG